MTADLDWLCEFYTDVPYGYSFGEDKVLKLEKAPYGLKLAARALNQKLVGVLKEHGFKDNAPGRHVGQNHYSCWVWHGDQIRTRCNSFAIQCSPVNTLLCNQVSLQSSRHADDKPLAREWELLAQSCEKSAPPSLVSCSRPLATKIWLLRGARAVCRSH
jgi:hypothetical protein